MKTAYRLNIIWCLCTFPFPFLSASSHKWCLWDIVCTISVLIFTKYFTQVECLPSTFLLKINYLTFQSRQTVNKLFTLQWVENFFFCAKVDCPFVSSFVSSLTNTKDCKVRCRTIHCHWGSEKIFLVIKLKQCPQIIGNSLLYFWFEKKKSFLNAWQFDVIIIPIKVLKYWRDLMLFWFFVI